MGQPLEDGKQYGISIVTEYSGAQLGEPSNFGTFAIPIDDVPEAPAWANATMNPDQEGEMILEWAACTELRSCIHASLEIACSAYKCAWITRIPGTNHPSFRSKYNFN